MRQYPEEKRGDKVKGAGIPPYEQARRKRNERVACGDARRRDDAGDPSLRPLGCALDDKGGGREWERKE